MSTVHQTRDVYCPFTESVPLIERFCRVGPVKIGPFAFIEFAVDATVAETRDYTDRTRHHEALVIQWKNHTLFPVPRFRGILTVRPNGLATEIRIEGHYTPPLGAFGQIFDAAVGRHIARRSLGRFLGRIAAFINGEYGKKRMLDPNW
ncbi:MAG: hypothetical protein ACYDGM_04185 [Vulcanimicrobiaceae bacterium]